VLVDDEGLEEYDGNEEGKDSDGNKCADEYRR
jgi:hypothetical protein